MSLPKIIQAGMGIGVSNWLLARTVSMLGQLGVVSGVVLDIVFARRLQDGDQGGHMRRALAEFPDKEMAQGVFKRYFTHGGKSNDEPYLSVPMITLEPEREVVELGIVAGFCEVYLAKEGHNGLVGMNVMQKLAITNLPIIYGAMLAGLDHLIIGAGIPNQIPGILDCLSENQAATQQIPVMGASNEDDFRVEFNPASFGFTRGKRIKRPLFLPIVAADALAISLARKAGRIDGFVIEKPIAGGHNAPPRGEVRLDESGQPIYGSRDEVNLTKIAKLGLPYWLAGGYAHTEDLNKSLRKGAAGVQIGTAFANCDQSGFTGHIKDQLIAKVQNGDLVVFTDPVASPTGFPFKVAKLEGTLSEQSVYESRNRICDLGYLRQAYKKSDGSVGYRCASEPVKSYIRKGGSAKETIGRKCLCNGLLANIGHPQVRKNGYREPMIITAGDETSVVRELAQKYGKRYNAEDVIAYMLGDE